MSDKPISNFDYIKTAEKLADAFRELAKFDTIERCKGSPLMTDAADIFKQCASANGDLRDFFICVGIALTFNMASDAPDHVTDDISDDYISKHPKGN